MLWKASPSAEMPGRRLPSASKAPLNRVTIVPCHSGVERMSLTVLSPRARAAMSGPPAWSAAVPIARMMPHTPVATLRNAWNVRMPRSTTSKNLPVSIIISTHSRNVSIVRLKKSAKVSKYTEPAAASWISAETRSATPGAIFVMASRMFEKYWTNASSPRPVVSACAVAATHDPIAVATAGIQVIARSRSLPM